MKPAEQLEKIKLDCLKIKQAMKENLRAQLKLNRRLQRLKRRKERIMLKKQIELYQSTQQLRKEIHEYYKAHNLLPIPQPETQDHNNQLGDPRYSEGYLRVWDPWLGQWVAEDQQNKLVVENETEIQLEDDTDTNNQTTE